jgi:hypothetical protein
LLSPAPELGWRRSEETWEATWGSWRREKAGLGLRLGLGLEEETENERSGGKEGIMEERDSMADWVLKRESDDDDMEGVCSELEMEDGVVGSELSDILE